MPLTLEVFHADRVSCRIVVKDRVARTNPSCPSSLPTDFGRLTFDLVGTHSVPERLIRIAIIVFELSNNRRLISTRQRLRSKKVGHAVTCEESVLPLKRSRVEIIINF